MEPPVAVDGVVGDPPRDHEVEHVPDLLGRGQPAHTDAPVAHLGDPPQAESREQAEGEEDDHPHAAAEGSGGDPPA